MPTTSISYKLLVEQQASYPPYPETANPDHFHFKCPHCLNVVSVAQSVAKHKCLHCQKAIFIRDLYGNLVLPKSEPPLLDRTNSDKAKSAPKPTKQRSITSPTSSSSVTATSTASAVSSSSSSAPLDAVTTPVSPTPPVQAKKTIAANESSGPDSDSEEGDVPLIALVKPPEDSPSEAIVIPKPFSNATDPPKFTGESNEVAEYSASQLVNYSAHIPPVEKSLGEFTASVAATVKTTTFSCVQLRPYQATGVNWLIRNFDAGLLSIVDLPTGVGKGVVISCFLTYLYAIRKISGPHLILTSSPAAAELWVERLRRYCPLHSFVNLAGPLADPEALAARLLSFNIYIATPQSLTEHSSLYSLPFLVRILCLVADDNISAFGEALTALQQGESTPFTCVTTKLRQDPEDLSTFPVAGVVEFLTRDPAKSTLLSRLPDCETVSVFQRTREQLQGEIPELKETLLFTPASAAQAEQYSALLKQEGPKNFEELRALVEKLERVCCHPCLATGGESLLARTSLTSESGKFYCLHRMVKGMQVANRQTAVFTQFDEMMDLFESYAKEEKISYVRINAKMSPTEVVSLNYCPPSTPPALFIVSSRYNGPALNLSCVYGALIYDQLPAPPKSILSRFNIPQVRSAHLYLLVGSSSVEEYLLRCARSAASPWTAEELWGAVRYGADIWLQNKAAVDVTSLGVEKLLKSTVLPEIEYNFVTVWANKPEDALTWEPESKSEESSAEPADEVIRGMYDTTPSSHQSDCVTCGKEDPDLACAYCSRASHSSCAEFKGDVWECSAHSCGVCGTRQLKTGKLFMMCGECKKVWCGEHFPTRNTLSESQPDPRLLMVTCFTCKSGPVEFVEVEGAVEAPALSPEVAALLRSALMGNGLEGEALDKATQEATKTLEGLAAQGLTGTALFEAWRQQAKKSNAKAKGGPRATPKKANGEATTEAAPRSHKKRLRKLVQDSDDEDEKESEPSEESENSDEAAERKANEEELERKQKEDEEKEKLYQEKFSVHGATLDGEDAWEAEEILQERKTKRGGLEYLVKWRGFDESHNSWEPRSGLKHCTELMDTWDSVQAKKKRKKKPH